MERGGAGEREGKGDEGMEEKGEGREWKVEWRWEEGKGRREGKMDGGKGRECKGRPSAEIP